MHSTQFHEEPGRERICCRICCSVCCACAPAPGETVADGPFRVLVLGERGVGKSLWIQKFQQSILPSSRSSGGGGGGGGGGGDAGGDAYVPCPLPERLTDPGLIHDLKTPDFSNACKRLITNRTIPACSPHLLRHTFDRNRPYPDIVLTENPLAAVPHIFLPLPPFHPVRTWTQQYDCVVILADYSNITSIRSVQHWCLVSGFSPAKTIVCVNKCDLEPSSADDDFTRRKAKLLRHFVTQCPIEYISAKNGKNVQFLYKYIGCDDFRDVLLLQTQRPSKFLVPIRVQRKKKITVENIDSDNEQEEQALLKNVKKVKLHS